MEVAVEHVNLVVGAIVDGVQNILPVAVLRQFKSGVERRDERGGTFLRGNC
jgi:hypothetical protein